MESDSKEVAFGFLHRNRRDNKPRTKGITEIRGPYYTLTGPRYLTDVFQSMGTYIDIFKFGGGSFALFPPSVLRELISLCHDHRILVSTGAFIQRVLTQGSAAVDQYIDECASFGFDIVQISAGLVSIPLDDVLRLAERIRKAGLDAQPEIDVQFGAGAGSTQEELKTHGPRSADWAIHQAERLLEEGAKMILVQSEGITESVSSWNTDFIARLVDRIGLPHLVFQAADPEVFTWYVKQYGPDVSLFIDHSQIIQLETLRAGFWGTASIWGRTATYG